VRGIENEGETMPRTRKSHPSSLKAKVAVEAIKAHKATAQINMDSCTPADILVSVARTACATAGTALVPRRNMAAAPQAINTAFVLFMAGFPNAPRPAAQELRTATLFPNESIRWQEIRLSGDALRLEPPPSTPNRPCESPPIASLCAATAFVGLGPRFPLRCAKFLACDMALLLRAAI
jgi:hypothetical protein